jgi:hypothetical protein
MSRFERCASLVIAAVALCGGLAPAPPANIPLAKEQLKLIDQVMADLDRMYKNGETSLTDPAFKLWARRRLDALRASGATKDAMVAELARYVDFMKKQESAWRVLYERDQATRADIASAQYERLEAEMLLNQEKAR